MYVLRMYTQDPNRCITDSLDGCHDRCVQAGGPCFLKKRKEKKRPEMCECVCVRISGNATLSCALAIAGKQICRKELEEVHNTLPTDTDMV